MRKLAVLALALVAAEATACEVLFPFDRSLIPEEAGAPGIDSSVPDAEEEASTPLEDATPTLDALVPPAEAGDAAVDHDAQVGDGAAGDGSADGTSSVDATSDVNEPADASDAGAAG